MEIFRVRARGVLNMENKLFIVKVKFMTRMMLNDAFDSTSAENVSLRHFKE